MQLVISPTGVVQCVYDEVINLPALGSLEIQRASQVEPNADGAWQADLSKMLGPILGPFELRSQALLAEREWLETQWLGMAWSGRGGFARRAMGREVALPTTTQTN